jgi:hypothetical protein
VTGTQAVERVRESSVLSAKLGEDEAAWFLFHLSFVLKIRGTGQCGVQWVLEAAACRLILAGAGHRVGNGLHLSPVCSQQAAGGQ